jgi:acyl carrier protein
MKNSIYDDCDKVKIPNEIFDERVPNITNMSALKCYLIIIANTYSFERVMCCFSVNEIAHMTELSRQSVSFGIRWLENNRYIWILKYGNIGQERIVYFLYPESEKIFNGIKIGSLDTRDIFLKAMKELDCEIIIEDLEPKIKKIKNKVQGYIYFILDKYGNCKIGKTTDLNRRIGEYTKLPYEPICHHVIFSKDITQSEKYFHEKFADKRLRGEWFLLSKDDLDYISYY